MEKFSKFLPQDAQKIHSLALSVLGFLCKTFSKSLKLTLQNSSFTSTSFSNCFSHLSIFLYSKLYQNNYMPNWLLTDSKLIRLLIQLSFVEIQLKKRNLKCFLGAGVWAPKLVYQSPKRPEYIRLSSNPFKTHLGITKEQWNKNYTFCRCCKCQYTKWR